MKTVLLVEDEQLIKDLLEKKLTQAGYRAITAFNGQDGLELARSAKPDLILLDMLMPRMTGIEMLQAIRQDEQLKEVPAIIISNSGQPVELEQAKKLGISDWVIKTDFDPNEVVDKVKGVIG